MLESHIHHDSYYTAAHEGQTHKQPGKKTGRTKTCTSRTHKNHMSEEKTEQEPETDKER